MNNPISCFSFRKRTALLCSWIQDARWSLNWLPGHWVGLLQREDEDQHEFTQIQTRQAWVDFLSFAVNSFDDVPSELSVAVHHFDDIRHILTTWHHHSCAFLWNLRLISRIIWKILFVCFRGFTKNYWPNISFLDEVNSIFHSFYFLKNPRSPSWGLMPAIEFFNRGFVRTLFISVSVDMRRMGSELGLLEDLSHLTHTLMLSIFIILDRSLLISHLHVLYRTWFRKQSWKVSQEIPHA